MSGANWPLLLFSDRHPLCHSRRFKRESTEFFQKRPAGANSTRAPSRNPRPFPCLRMSRESRPLLLDSRSPITNGGAKLRGNDREREFCKAPLEGECQGEGFMEPPPLRFSSIKDSGFPLKPCGNDRWGAGMTEVSLCARPNHPTQEDIADGVTPRISSCIQAKVSVPAPARSSIGSHTPD